MGNVIISHNQRKDNMTKETLDLIKDFYIVDYAKKHTKRI